MIEDAAAALGLRPRDCAVVGDIGADVAAAAAAGARGVLVPTAATLDTERHAAPETATDLVDAVQLLIDAGASNRAEGRVWFPFRG